MAAKRIKQQTHQGVNTLLKLISKESLFLFRRWHSWCTTDPLKVLIKKTTPFLDSVSNKNWQKVVSIVKTQLMWKIRTTTNDSHLVQLFGWWSSRSWLTVTMSIKKAVADPLSKYLVQCSPVQCYQDLEGSCS